MKRVGVWVLDGAGVALLTIAGWLVTPALGLVVLGLAALAGAAAFESRRRRGDTER